LFKQILNFFVSGIEKYQWLQSLNLTCIISEIRQSFQGDHEKRLVMVPSLDCHVESSGDQRMLKAGLRENA